MSMRDENPRCVGAGALSVSCRSEAGHGSDLGLIAYRVPGTCPMAIVSASNRRDWMDATTARFANRCLPLRVANQAGWFLLNHQRCRAVWRGGRSPAAVEIQADGPLTGGLPISHFGHGILTWKIPFLFRTPSGFNLVVRGPTNTLKDGAVPLDAIVETDWAVATFTMNWKFTRPGVWVVFESGEAICMICPQRRHDLESFCPEIRDLAQNPELAMEFQEWKRSRLEFNETLLTCRHVPNSQAWQKHYFFGATPRGVKFDDHDLKMCPAAFRDKRTVADEEGDLLSNAEPQGTVRFAAIVDRLHSTVRRILGKKLSTQ